MQITISESEIKKAIISYMHARIKIEPGMQFEIDLKATRGAEGATAIIDIVDDPRPAAVQEPKKEIKDVANEVKATSAKLFTAPVVETPATVTVDEAIASIPEIADSGYPKPPADNVLPIPDEVEVPVPARTSLFAGLKKPVNA